ncbi:MAG: hypothetical protein K2J85_03070, partial [Anaeroplasmataceae bacterium]|nr:hypothetical protein [Anaeroplasmataceae bacterium]
VLDKEYVLNTEIAQKKIAAPENQQETYTGDQISYTKVPSNAVYSVKEYSQDEVINVGTYTVTFEIKTQHQRNYTWDTVDTATLTIVEENLIAVVTNTANVYYDRTTKAGVSVRFRNAAGETISLPANSYTITYDGLTDKPRYAKEYDVVISLTNQNYLIESSTTTGFTLEDSRTITGKFTILKARIFVDELDLGADHKHIYNGSDYNADGNFFTTHYSVTNQLNSGIIPLEYDGTDGYQVTYNEAAELKNAATYTVKYTLYGASYDNFIIVDGDNECTEWTSTVVIQAANIRISVTKSYTYTGSAQAVDIVLTNTSGTNVRPTNALSIQYQKGLETEFLNAGLYTVT